MNRRKRRKYKRYKYLLFVVLIFLLFWQATKLYFQPTVIGYAKQKSIFYSSIVINNAIRDQVLNEMDVNKIVVLETQSSGHVTSVQVDTYEANKILAKVTEQIQNEIIAIENDENNDLRNLEIPLGVIFDNPYLSKYGPKLSVDLIPVGSIRTDIVSTVEPYGINNSLIEVNLETRVIFQVIIPFQKDEIEVVTHTPILVKIIHGEVPRYYYRGGGTYPLSPNNDDGYIDQETPNIEE